MQAIIYKLATGEIVRSVSTRTPHLQCGPGEAWLEGAGDPAAQYVAGGELRAKRPMALVVTDHGVDGLSEGAVVHIDGQQYAAAGRSIRFAFSLPGPYRAEVVAPGFMSTVVELAAQEAAPEGVSHQASYVARRVAEYPDVRDQIDAIMKGGAALEAMREQVLAVKARYPKT